ncbi:MAG: ribosome recycling factor [Clostridia bacterium]|nr:ribosome recycling factor [Clostridia bacterium]
MLPELEEELFYLEEKLEKAVNHLSSEYITVRAGRANPKILDNIMVDYYGSPTPLKQMANISVPEPRMLVINLFDRSAAKETVKAIVASDLGINPSDDGKLIRLVFPQLTQERRKDLVKQVKKMAEDSKVVLRNERRDALDKAKKLKKELNFSEDELTGFEKDVQKALDKYIAQVDDMSKNKEKEILEI